MRDKIHRFKCEIGIIFSAPKNVTFGYQPSRKEFSVWYDPYDDKDTRYIVIPTGPCALNLPTFTIDSTVIVSDHYAFHLLKEDYKLEQANV